VLFRTLLRVAMAVGTAVFIAASGFTGGGLPGAAGVPTVSSVTPNSGPAAGGTSVTIAGSGFTGATAVAFGQTAAASYVLNSDSQITAVSPAEPDGTVDVTVTTTAYATIAAITALIITTLPAQAASNVNRAARSQNWSTYLFGPEHASMNAGATGYSLTSSFRPVLAWEWKEGSTLYASPTVYGGTVYIGAEDGWFYAINEATGGVIWRHLLAGSDPCPGNMNVRGLTSTATVAPDPVTGTPTVIVASTPGPSGGIDVNALNAATGALEWRTAVTTQKASYAWSSPTLVNGHVYIGIASMCDDPLIQGGLAELDQHTGTLLADYWSEPSGKVGASIWSSAAVNPADGSAWVTTGNGDVNPGDSYSIVRLNSKLVKQELWTVPGIAGLDLDFGASPTLFTAVLGGVSTTMVGVCNKNGIFYAFKAYDLAAGPVWTLDEGVHKGECLAAAVWDASRNELFLASLQTTINGRSFQGSVREVNPATGTAIWQTGFPSEVFGTPTLDGSGVLAVQTILGTDAGVYLLSETTGAQLAQLSNPGWVFAQPVFAGGYLFVASATKGALFAYRPTNLAAPVVGMCVDPKSGGFWLASSKGNVYNFGNAPFYGSEAGKPVPTVVGTAADPSTGGYWLVTHLGNVYSFGAPFYGSEVGKALPAPVVGMAVDPSGRGYWLVTSKGNVYNFGNAPFYGSSAHQPLPAPVVGMALDPKTGGYWLVTSKGNVYNYKAPFLGSKANQPLPAPIVGMVASPKTGGYWLVTSKGNVYNYGVPFFGSTSLQTLPSPVVGMAVDSTTGGYWLETSRGSVYNYNAPDEVG
jgi:outer membrane protein assembly factor BamB